MSEILLRVKDTRLTLEGPAWLVGTQVEYNTCKFDFGPEWADFVKTAVFRTGDKTINMVLDEDDKCNVPWESVAEKGVLYVGVFGTRDGVVIPTNFVTLNIVEGSAGNHVPAPPSLDVYMQIMQEMGDTRDYIDNVEAAIESKEQARQDEYVEAEADRNSRYNEAEGTRNEAYGDAENQRDSGYAQEKSARNNAYNGAEGTRNNSYEIAEASRNRQYDEAEEARDGLYEDAEADRDSRYEEAEEDRDSRLTAVEDAVGDIDELDVGETDNLVGAVNEVASDLATHKEDYVQYKDTNNLKIAKVEKDINDYQQVMSQVNVNQEAKQSVSGYGIISLPKNTANGQVSVTLKGLTATNLVRNGNFANGATDWTTVGGSIAINDGVATLTGSGSYNFVYANQNVGAFKANHKYYLACRLKPVSNKITLLQMSLTPSGGGSSLFIQRVSFEYGAWNFISSVVTSSVEQLGDILFRPRFNFSSAEDAVNQTGEIDDCFVVDLTATFGTGNEPTVEECDKIFPHWFDGTKSTVGAMRIRIVSEDEVEGSTAYVLAKDEDGNIEELRSLPNGTKDEVSVGEGKATQNVSEDTLVSDTVYDSIDTTTYTNVDVVITTAFADAKAGTTGADGQTHYYNKDGVELAEVAEADIDLEASVGKYYWGEDKKLYIIVAKGTYADIAAARTGLGTTSLTYQLATPIEIPIQTSGSLVSYPSGTIYVEPIVADAGIYTDKMSVLHQDLPIKAIEKLSKVDFITGLETELDVSETVIAGDKLSFTHPDLEAGDIVFFVYEYDRESTVGETEIEYYDSRYVVKDDVTEKFYKWAVAVADGVPSIELTEV